MPAATRPFRSSVGVVGAAGVVVLGIVLRVLRGRLTGLRLEDDAAVAVRVGERLRDGGVLRRHLTEPGAFRQTTELLGGPHVERDEPADARGPAGAASARSFKSQRILDDGTNTSYFNTAVSAGWLGDVVIGVRLNGAMAALGSPSSTGTGFALAKVRPDNSGVVWRQNYSGSVPVTVTRVLVDESDDVYVTGNVAASQSAAIGALTVTGGHGFVAKLRGSDGALQWAFQVDGTTSSAVSLSTKPGQPIALAGTFRGTLSYPLKAGGNLTKAGDDTRASAYVMTLDRVTGKASWARAFLSSVSPNPAVDADMAPNGSVEIALGMSGTITGDPSGTVATLPDVSAVFATLAAANGAHSNVAQFRTVSMSSVAVRALPGGGAVGAGEAATTNTTIPNYQGVSSTDTWIMGMSAAHAQQWTHWFGGKYAGQTSDKQEYLGCLGVDHWGRVVIGVSAFSGSGLRLDNSDIPGMRTTASYAGQLVLAKFTSGGTTLWSHAMHAGDSAEVRSLSCGFALNGDTIFSADLGANATPNFWWRGAVPRREQNGGRREVEPVTGAPALSPAVGGAAARDELRLIPQAGRTPASPANAARHESGQPSPAPSLRRDNRRCARASAARSARARSGRTVRIRPRIRRGRASSSRARRRDR
jgi:hypothetical protein